MVIDIAYRLGIYGFLWSPTAENNNEPYQGNWGLIDQTQALAWGSIFAKYFGGDASEVIFEYLIMSKPKEFGS